MKKIEGEKLNLHEYNVVNYTVNKRSRINAARTCVIPEKNKRETATMMEKSPPVSWKRERITESSENILVYCANYGKPSVNNFRLAISLVIVL